MQFVSKEDMQNMVAKAESDARLGGRWSWDDPAPWDAPRLYDETM